MKVGGWIRIRVDNFVIFAHDPLASAISEKIGKPEEKIEEPLEVVPKTISVYAHEEQGFEIPVFKGWKLEREWKSHVDFVKEYKDGSEAKLFVDVSFPYVDTLQDAIGKHLRSYDPLEYEGYTTLAGEPAYEAIKDVKQKFGRWEKSWLVFVIHNSKDYKISLEVTGDDPDSVHSLFTSLKPTFKEFMKGFKFIK